MRSTLKLFVLVAALLMATSAFALQDSPAPAKKTVTKKKTTTTTMKKTTESPEMKELRETLANQQRMMEEQGRAIQQLQQELQRRDAATQQATDAARDAAQKADAAAAQAAQEQQNTAALQSTVSDLRANATTLAGSMQEDQKKYADMVESPVALHFKGMTITPIGFLAAETTWRQRAMASDVNTPFNSIPFTNADAGRQTEFFGTGRQSRLAFLAEGKLSNMKIGGYWEMDWLGAGVTSNNNQSNSYVNRQRQLWAQVAMNNGWTVTGGQMWSLVTETKKGLDNRSEALPMSIDAQYVVGFSWARQYGLRVTKNFNNKAWFGIAMENPQTTFSASNAPTNFVIGNFGAGGGLYNGGGGAPAGAALANYSFNSFPDIIVKAAFEPGFGHWELFGVISQFRDRIYPNAPTNATGAFNDSRTGGGFGANARFTLAKKFDIGFHGLVGDGVGRYGTSGLPDATVRPDGTLSLLHSYQGLATLELHTKRWDVYGNGGGEYVSRAIYLNSGGTQVGYGLTTNNNSGCNTEVLPGAGGFLPNNPGSCSGQTRAVFEGTVGFWFKPYNGPKGRIQFGPQWAYIVRNTWGGTAGAGSPNNGSPNASNNVLMTSFRYYLP